MKKAGLLAVVVMTCIALIIVSFVLVSAEPRTGKGKVINSVNLPKTGSTIDDVAGIRDDAELQIGVEWPVPRFVDNLDGTVTDRLTRLVWLMNDNCFGPIYWYGALESCYTLQSGMCGLSDNSVPGDWRLPNRNELSSLIDVGKGLPALPEGYPFTNVVEGQYWTSTTAMYNHPAEAWYVYMYDGSARYTAKSSTLLVWPVRSSN